MRYGHEYQVHGPILIQLSTMIPQPNMLQAPEKTNNPHIFSSMTEHPDFPAHFPSNKGSRLYQGKNA